LLALFYATPITHIINYQLRKGERMNPQDRPSIFLSSTTLDFFKYRRSIKEALQSRGFPTIVMEDFPPSPDGVAGISIQKVRESDIYVVLLGYRYGTGFPEPSSPSVTELEFREARQTGKLIFAYIPNEQDPPVFEYEVKDFDGKWMTVRMTRDNMHPRQQQFISTVTNDMMKYVAATYSNPADLPVKVVGDILQGLQGSAPGEMSYRKGLAALSLLVPQGAIVPPPNYDAGIYSLELAARYLGNANRPEVPFLQALAMLRGYAPFDMRDEDIAPMEDLLRNSLRMSNSGKGFCSGYLLWAAIKKDHYLRRGMVNPHQALHDEMLRRAVPLFNLEQDRKRILEIQRLSPYLYNTYIRYYPPMSGGNSLF
jgi:hypothetical protein